ncbi:hypothetical protein CXB51_022766 [Gossypium anomalum]|uniref:Uncharacterized protein n=1 Tax=Gossypium anomalum TaxID=47600 RepID=A0A8J5Y762_9ROSI|nr:hypothetical protein CXB51_022766 [Gossypium anomalum]
MIIRASSGIDTETTRVLALRGVHRYQRSKLSRKFPIAKVDAMELDLSSMASVRKFESDFSSSDPPLNLLINNATIIGIPFTLSKDKIELLFATNHIGGWSEYNSSQQMHFIQEEFPPIFSGIWMFLVGAATTDPEVKGKSGQYFKNSNIDQASEHGRDVKLAKKLWDFSIKIIE